MNLPAVEHEDRRLEAAGGWDGQVLAEQDPATLKTALQQAENTVNQDEINVKSTNLTLETNRKTLARQQQLFDLVKERKEVPKEEAARVLGISEDELQREFAVLRHLELLRACKKDEGIFLIPF